MRTFHWYVTENYMNSHTVVDHPLAAMHSAGQAGRGRTLNSHVNRLLNDRVPHLKRRRGLGRAHGEFVLRACVK